MDRNRTTTMCKLNQELIVEILTFLPVKSLLRFKSVCKWWYSLISSPEFAKWHLKRAKQEDRISRCSRVLLPSLPMAKSFDFEAASNMLNPRAITEIEDPATPNDPDMALLTEEIIALDDPDMVLLSDAITPLNYPASILFRTQYYVEILGSCNGLVCLSNVINGIVLWNPSTRVSKILPKHSIPQTDEKFRKRHIHLGIDVSFSGLGYDKSADDYKLIVGYKTHTQAHHIVAQSIEILSLKSNSWTKIKNEEEVTIVNTGIYLDQYIHWIGLRKSYNEVKCEIVSFDITKENFRNVLPFTEEIGDNISTVTSLGLSRNRLCLFYERRDRCFEAWVVEGLGTNAAWTNLFVVDIFRFTPLCLTNNGKLVFDSCKCVGIFDALKGSRSVFDRLCTICDSSVYLETLVSPCC